MGLVVMVFITVFFPLLHIFEIFHKTIIIIIMYVTNDSISLIIDLGPIKLVNKNSIIASYKARCEMK